MDDFVERWMEAMRAEVQDAPDTVELLRCDESETMGMSNRKNWSQGS